MLRHRLGEERARLYLLADVVDDDAEGLVVRLLLEDHERGHDREAGLDHRRELAREDLQRLRLHLLREHPRLLLVRAGGALDLGNALGEQPAVEQDVPRRGQVSGVDLARELVSLGVDCAVGELRHLEVSYGAFVVVAALLFAAVVNPSMTSGCAPV